MMIRIAAVLGFVWVRVSWGDLYTYECETLPETVGWTQINFGCGAQEWIEDGLLVQYVPLCAESPGYGAQIDYAKLIGDLSEETAWFAEWRVITDGPSEELGYTAPAAVLVWDGDGGVIYHFTIADDRFRLIANEFESLHDLEPGVPHTFRVELFGANLGEFYGIYVDGQEIFSGVPVGPLWFPPWPPEVKFRAKSKLEPSTTTWDYIRWGHITDTFGDFNSDGQINSDDLYFFTECLTTEAGNWIGCSWADSDGDGDVDCADAEAFAAAWTDPLNPPSLPECSILPCPADVDGSGVVDASDLAQVLGAWGPNPESSADLNQDGVVNAFDLAMLLGSWGACD